MPRSIHAVSAKGFILKVSLFLVASRKDKNHPLAYPALMPYLVVPEKVRILEGKIPLSLREKFASNLQAFQEIGDKTLQIFPKKFVLGKENEEIFS